MPELAFRVNAITTGSPSHRFEHLRKNYVYGGEITEAAETETRHSLPVSSSKSPSARAERMAVFAAARAEGKSVAEAGQAAGVTLTTAKTYRRELEQPGGGDD
jgi:hypothetical protein